MGVGNLQGTHCEKYTLISEEEYSKRQKNNASKKDNTKVSKVKKDDDVYWY